MRTIIVAVTKSFPFEIVKKAYVDGYRHLGENRVEEAKEKILKAQETGMNDIIWHMIGHVQSRKVRDVVALFDRVDSVDSIELLQQLDKEAEKIGKVLSVLLEINISGESGKYGFRNFDASMLRHIDAKHLKIDGLMTMAPYVKNPEENRMIFRSLKKLSTTASNIGKALSMGTSCDYTVATQEGATEVRLGEALFGPRE